MTYDFTHVGNILLLLLVAIGIWASRLDFRLEAGWDFGFEARIWALRLGFGP